MTNHISFLSAVDRFTTSAAAGGDSRVHINRLRVSAREAFDRVNISLASLQSSQLLLAEIERSRSLRPIALRLPERPVLGTAALRTEPHSRPIWWDVYPALPKSIRLGEIEAADQREAIERAAKKFEQPPAILIVIRRA
jgi:hypothetical protein